MKLYFQAISTIVLRTISNKIVDTFTFLTPYFVTVIPFPLLACPFSSSPLPPPPPPPQKKQCCAAIAVIAGSKQATLNGGAESFPQIFRGNKSAVFWHTISTMERQCLNSLCRRLQSNKLQLQLSSGKSFPCLHSLI